MKAETIEQLRLLSRDMEDSVCRAADMLKPYEDNPLIAYGIYIEKLAAFYERLDETIKTIEQ